MIFNESKTYSYSIIIVTHNSKQFIKKCLDSVHQQIISNYEIIIIDTNSNDSTISEIGDAKNDRVILLKDNVGYGKANNIGAKLSKKDFLIFLNPDVYVDQSWLKSINDFILLHPDFVCGSPAILDARNPSKIHSLGLYLDVFGNTGSVGKNLPRHNLPNTIEMIAPSGACCIIKRSLFHNIGEFVEDYFLYCEDLDLGLRILMNGFPLHFIPNTVVYHYGFKLLEEYSELNLYYLTRNKIWTIYRDCPIPLILFLNVSSIVTAVSEIIYFNLNKKPSLAKATGKGLIDGLLNQIDRKHAVTRYPYHLLIYPFESVKYFLRNISSEF